jgi:hypothetical protein
MEPLDYSVYNNHVQRAKLSHLGAHVYVSINLYIQQEEQDLHDINNPSLEVCLILVVEKDFHSGHMYPKTRVPIEEEEKKN